MRATTTALAALLASAAALPATAQVQERTITISNGVAETHPVGNGVQAMQACFDERTGGTWTLNAFWSAALGNDLDATQALRSGTQEMVVTSTSPLVGIEPALGVFDLPFLFADDQEADAILDGEFGAMISEKMEAHGLINLAYWENGFRNLTNSVRPVTKLEDLEGMRVRVMQNDIFLDTFSNLGTNAMPMAFGEVFTALETGTIDAQENPYVTIDTSQFSEVQEYLTETRHAYTPFMVLFSKAIFDTYSPEEQQILRDCAMEGQAVQRQASRELSQQSLERVQEAGMKFNQLEPTEMERIREAVATVYETHADTIGRDVVEAMQAALDELRSGG
ncbi:TRAP transporter substrate-binding protein [Rubellimicrobium rubrum]|uniref:TRAP transporter substrate-binding protein n=1 Tax=Rubellimicrobium rubrum TaxID=2585369 RepID=A0A5C4MNT6_9RHOB|nr:TRAP transporter substrate-binding protein [Rubellimicrobium rubrum]TNC47488.1 TRAP transporter substrate-binding protein [Rubellimicrobium rubrum]